MLSLLVLAFIVMFAVGTLPSWRYSAQWGYGPSSGLGLIAIIIILMILFGRF